MAKIENSLTINSFTNNQNNIDIVKYINNYPSSEQSILTIELNDLPTYTISEIQSLWFVVYVWSSQIEEVDSIPQLIATNLYKVINTGKGTYGVGGIQLTQDNLLFVSSTGLNLEDIENNPLTQVYTIEDLGGLTISEYINQLNPAFLFQDVNIAPRLIKVIEPGNEADYLFLPPGGLYGQEELQTIDFDFQILNRNVNIIIINNVNTINELRLLRGEINQQISLLGYYEKGDKQSLNYIYKIGNFIDDGGSIIIPTGDIIGAWIAIFDGDISVKHFGANNGLDDNLDSIQRCVNYCLENNFLHITLDNYTFNIDGILSVNRPIDASESSSKFYIKNGGLNQKTATSIVRGAQGSEIVNSQLVCFQNVTFSSENNSTVLYKSTILRMFFESCSFVGIRFCETYDYLQSIYFNDCNYRYWSGDFFLTYNGLYDIHFKGGLAEHGVNFINVNPIVEDFTKTERINGLFVDNMCIEGLEGCGILYQDCNSLFVSNTYFEANQGGDILNSSDNSQNTNYNVNLNKNIHLLGASEPAPNHDGEFYHVIFNSTQSGTFKGNFSTGNLSYMKSDYFTVELGGNYAQNGIITNKENCIGNIKTYYGDDLSPETLNFDVEILKGATVFVRNFNPATSNLIGWTCVQSGDYLTATWTELFLFTQEVDDNLLHKTGNETKKGILALERDGAGAIPMHLILRGLTNPDFGLYAGVNTTTNKGQVQVYWDGVGFPTLQLQPTGGDIEIPDAISGKNPLSYRQLGTGWASYGDTIYTSTSPFTINSGVTSTIPNNAGTIINSQLPLGVTSWYNSTTNKFTPSLDGDYYTITVRFKAQTTSPTAGYFDFGIDIGGVLGVQFKETKIFAKGAGIEHNFSLVIPCYTASTFVANGGLMKLTSGNGNMTVYDINFQFDRTHKSK